MLGTLLLAVPLIFGSLSGVLCERAGVVNIAIEGQLLFGAFLAAVVASLTQNVWLGLIAAPLAGLLLGLLLFLLHFVELLLGGLYPYLVGVGRAYVRGRRSYGGLGEPRGGCCREREEQREHDANR